MSILQREYYKPGYETPSMGQETKTFWPISSFNPTLSDWLWLNCEQMSHLILSEASWTRQVNWSFGVTSGLSFNATVTSLSPVPETLIDRASLSKNKTTLGTDHLPHFSEGFWKKIPDHLLES